MAHFDAERRMEAQQLQKRIDEIKSTIYSDRRPIGNCEFVVTGTGKGPERAPAKGWKPFDVSKQQRWGGYDQTTWFRFQATIPKAWKGMKAVALVRPSLTSFALGIEGLSAGAEALAYIDGVPFQGLDFNRDELLLARSAKGGEKHEIVLEGVPSTRWDVYHHFAYADLAVKHPLVWDFYWDAFVTLGVVQTLDDNFAPKRQLHELLTDAVWMVDLQRKGEAAYYDSIAKAQRFLRKGLKGFETSTGMGKLTLTGHAHIDTAWLWPLRETQRKCSRTFSTVLNLMDQYPEFKFSCSQPAQYEWIKENHPELYARIKKRVKEGRWECCGAPYIEPDCNVPSGESLVRQFLFGNRFFEKEFGVRSRLAWQPDAFGYSWQLPQIMRKSGLTAFVTTKIDWSQYTQFPYSLFHWEGADGTKILTVMPPLNYNGNPVPQDLVAQWSLFKQKERVEELPFPFGWGDGGGGPTMGMIEHGKRLTNMAGIPKCEFGTNQESLDRINAQVEHDKLPVFNGELYLELHRGCQTTQARTKRGNRKGEVALHDAEVLGAMALLEGGKYASAELEKAWKLLLLNQFHDILPGSSITEVYTDAERDYGVLQELAAKAQWTHLSHLVKAIDTTGDGQPVIVFNTLSWLRTGIACVEAELPKGVFHVAGPDGRTMAHQKIGKNTLLIEVEDLPPMGYAVYRIVPGKGMATDVSELAVSEKSVENEFFRLAIGKDGTLTSVFDKYERREVLPKGERANVLQLFDDRPYDHDAWDIDHNIEWKTWEPEPAESIKVVEQGPLRAVVRIVRRTAKSVISQDLTVYATSPRIDFVTTVDWNEKRTLLKAAFPADIRSSRATYEIAFGAIERATHYNTAWDRARHEVAGHRWADLSEGDYGISVLNDCKYGWDCKDNTLRLSLLRSSVDPDPRADEGRHEFTYALYPHAESWRNGTVQQGFDLNHPFIAVAAKPAKGELPAAGALVSIDVDHAIVDTVKKAEDSNALIVRVYEAYGQRGPVTLTFGRKPKRVTECDLMEENDAAVKMDGANLPFYVKPFEIRTFKAEF